MYREPARGVVPKLLSLTRISGSPAGSITHTPDCFTQFEARSKSRYSRICVWLSSSMGTSISPESGLSVSLVMHDDDVMQLAPLAKHPILKRDNPNTTSP